MHLVDDVGPESDYLIQVMGPRVGIMYNDNHDLADGWFLVVNWKTGEVVLVGVCVVSSIFFFGFFLTMASIEGL